MTNKEKVSSVKTANIQKNKNSKKLNQKKSFKGKDKNFQNNRKKTNANKTGSLPERKENELKLEDVLAFEGNENEFSMLQEVDNDDSRAVTEYTQSTEIDEELSKELKNLVGSLGLESFVMEDEKDEVPAATKAEEPVQTEKEATKEDEKEVSSVYNMDLDDDSDDEFGHLPDYLMQKYSRAPKNRSKAVLPTHSSWYKIELPELNLGGQVSSVPRHEADTVKEYARQVYEKEVELYLGSQDSRNSGDLKWMNTVAASGTQSDKLAAKVVMLQESVVHQLSTLLSVLAMTQKKKREALLAIESLKRVWIDNLLPDTRKLKYFYQQPLLAGNVTDTHLMLWYFEDKVKTSYVAYLNALEKTANDVQLKLKTTATKLMLELLSERPEQEQILLTLIVNKVGDPEKQLASKIPYFLNTLVTEHPNMRLTIVKEIEQILHRPNVGARAQYYCVCFLNQLILQQSDEELSNKLIEVYFTMFSIFSKDDLLQTKMLSGLLVGVNRAFPFSNMDKDSFEKHIDTLFQVVHVDNFATSVQALMLLFQVMFTQKSVSDRFYRSLYQKIADSFSISDLRVSTSFFNLIFKSVSIDQNSSRVQAFVKRLLQLCLVQQPQHACAILFLVSETAKTQKNVLDIVRKRKDLETKEESKKAAGDKPKAKIWTDSYGNYDPSKREPKFSGAELSYAWELSLLGNHYHPSVANFARQLVEKGSIRYDSDPLQDFTLMRFLDKFVYKNPKAAKVESVLEKKKSNSFVLANTKAFLNQKESNISVDDVFMYKFFKEKALRDKAPKKEKKKTIDEDFIDFDDDDEVSELDEDEVASALAEDDEFSSYMEANDMNSDEDNKDSNSDDDDDNSDDSKDESSSSKPEFDYADMGDFSEDGEDLDGDEGFDFEGVALGDSDSEDGLMMNKDSNDDDDESEEDTKHSNKKKTNKRNAGAVSSFADLSEYEHLIGAEVDDTKKKTSGKRKRRKQSKN